MSTAEEALARLLALMARLRDPQSGCPWDLKQTFATIAPYTIEEAYEVADAIERDDREHLRDELGDLLFQVVFHARLAEERGWFDFAAVARGIDEKLRRRHPHIFAGAALAAEDLVRVWEEQKAEERAAAAGGAAAGALSGVPRALPALTRAAKLGKRAATVGFDWPDVAGVRAKVDEELGELDAAAASGDRDEIAAEMGDLLFSVANWCRHLTLDPETCLRSANERFTRRFRGVESDVAASGRPWSSHDAAALDELWRRAKAKR